MGSKRLLVLGASGMLGSTVFRTLHSSEKHEVFATLRNSRALHYFSQEQQVGIVSNIDILKDEDIVAVLGRIKPDIIINCVGLIKQLAASKDPLVALPLNALFSHKLVRLSKLCDARVIHVSTDCVFTGDKGKYVEADIPDATDLYGISKRLGELTDYENAVTLRTSIIGRELCSSNSLLDWFLSQKGQVKGFTKAIFSGLPTCELANIIQNVIIPNLDLRGLYHVAAEPISKYDLLKLIAAQYNQDIEILPDDNLVIDRSLNSAKFAKETNYVAAQWPELIKCMYKNDLRRNKRRV